MSRVKRDEPARATRIPVSSSRAPLVVKGFDHKNFQGRWVADIETRLQDFLDGGYEFVNKSDIVSAGEAALSLSQQAGPGSRITKPGGRGVTLFLMRIPRKLYDEDRKAKDKEIDQTEEGMKKSSKRNADYGSLEIGSDIKSE